jgi:hypothetical protein
MISLTATELPRFMACNGSQSMTRLEPYEPDESVEEEGNAAHWLVEQMFKLPALDINSFLNKEAPNGVFITTEMLEHCERYIQDINALGGSVEVHTTLRFETFDIRGRADHIAVVNSVLYINDFKYGWRIVEPEMNWTLIWHALAFMHRESPPVDEIVFRIYQPRPFHPLGNVREWRINRAKLSELTVILNSTCSNPQQVLNSGSHCYRCPSLAVCPAAQIASMNSIDVSQKTFDSHVNNEQLSFMLDQTSKAIKTLEQSRTAYEELASHRIKAGQTVPEYSMQTDLSQKQWKKGLTAEIMQTITGLDLSKKQLVTPNQAETLGVNKKVIETLTERNTKGLKLVRLDERKKAEKLLLNKGK